MTGDPIGTTAHVPPGFTTNLAPWEDGLRAAVGPDTYEWWYFDAILFDQHNEKYTCTIIFFSNRPFVWSGQVRPAVRFTLSKPNGHFVRCHDEFEPGEFRQPPPPKGLDLRVGDNTAQGDLSTIVISAQGQGDVYDESMKHVGQKESIGAELTFTALMPAYRIGPATKTLPKFTTDQVIMPSGTAEGTITVGTETVHVSGNCYHDHQWGPCLGNLDNSAGKAGAQAANTSYAAFEALSSEAGAESIREAPDGSVTKAYWYWGHFTAGDYAGDFALVYLSGVFMSNYSSFLLGKGEEILILDQDPTQFEMTKTHADWVLSWSHQYQNLQQPDSITATFSNPSIIGFADDGYRRYGSRKMTLEGTINGTPVNETGHVLWEYFPLNF